MKILSDWKQKSCQTGNLTTVILPTVMLTTVMLTTVGCKDLTSPNRSQIDPSLTTQAEVPESAGSPVAGSAPAGSLPDTPPSAEAAVIETPSGGEAISPAGTPTPAAVPSVPNQVPSKAATAIPAVKPDEIYPPSVVLSRAHEQTCLVNVGDTMPNLELQRFNGEPVALDDVRGEQLTVVVFWNNQRAFGREQFERLTAEVALPFRHLGVKVVAVNVGDPAEQIELDEAAKNEIVCLLDADGTAITKVATSKLPRTYLIDAAGKILWFDLEYSRTTRRQLKNAIFFHSRDEAETT